MNDRGDGSSNGNGAHGNGSGGNGSGGNGHGGSGAGVETVRGPDDLIQPFMLERSGVRGRLVRAGPMVDAILRRHNYPQPVAQLLGEMVALAGLLSAMLKYEGIFTVQASGDGPVSLLVADFTSNGEVRGYASYDEARVNQVQQDPKGTNAEIVHLMGSGRLAFTVDHAGAKDRYQGIVELNGQTLAECMHHYFQQSEQIAASIQLAAGQVTEADGETRWRAGGTMLQRLPEEVDDRSGEAADDDWRRAVILMSSVTATELVRPDLTAHELLYRLFHEEGVRVYDPRPLIDSCRCSRDKVADVLRQMERAELDGLKTADGQVEVTCEFCSTVYRFDDSDLAELFAHADGDGESAGGRGGT
jgi:molecular chaperone Hsp33